MNHSNLFITPSWQKHRDSSAPVTFTCLSIFVSEQLCGVGWDKMTKKATLPSKRSAVTNMPTSDLNLQCWHTPLTALTISYGTPGIGSWIPETRAKNRAMEGHIYISAALAQVFLYFYFILFCFWGDNNFIDCFKMTNAWPRKDSRR